MKRYILLSILAIVSITTNTFGQQEKNTAHGTDKGAKAFILNMNALNSVVQAYNKENIPYTNKINGKNFHYWIRYGDPIRTDNVSIVKQLEDGTFTQEKALDSFSRRELEKCYYEVYPFRTFEQSNRSMYCKNTDRSSYEPEHLSFIEQLQSDKCVLCMFANDKQVIVANAQGLPQQVCKALQLKKAADID
jgi:hypothetical protein